MWSQQSGPSAGTWSIAWGWRWPRHWDGDRVKINEDGLGKSGLKSSPIPWLYKEQMWGNKKGHFGTEHIHQWQLGPSSQVQLAGTIFTCSWCWHWISLGWEDELENSDPGWVREFPAPSPIKQVLKFEKTFIWKGATLNDGPGLNWSGTFSSFPNSSLKPGEQLNILRFSK